MKRQAWTLVELLVVIAIIAILLAMILPGIQSIRENSARLRTVNQIKQLNLGLQNYLSTHQDQLPGYKSLLYSTEMIQCPIEAVLPFVDSKSTIKLHGFDFYRCLINPSDPSIGIHPLYFDDEINDRSNFCVNPWLFRFRARFPASISDGTSNTIMFSEHYVNCGGNRYSTFRIGSFSTSNPDPNNPNIFLTTPIQWPNEHMNPVVHRPTFGDPWFSDVTPAIPSRLLMDPFQLAPRTDTCDPRIPQTPHRVLSIGLADGSVRWLSRTTHPSIFWSAVTPNGGEAVSLDE